MKLLKKLQRINENNPLIYENGKNDKYNEIIEKTKITQTIESNDGVLNLPLISSIDTLTINGTNIVTKLSDDTLPRYSITNPNRIINYETYNVNTKIRGMALDLMYTTRSLPGYGGRYHDVYEFKKNSQYATFTRKVASVTLNGADVETWLKVSTKPNLYYCELTKTTERFTTSEMDAIISGKGLLREPVAFSNWFGEMDSCCSQNVINGWTIYNGIRSATGEHIVRLFIQYDGITTLEEFKTKLAETPFTFYYLSIDGETTYKTGVSIIDNINADLLNGTINTVKFTPVNGVAETNTDIIQVLKNTGKIQTE